MHIVVGSQNPVKVEAARTVFRPLYHELVVSTCVVNSGVPEQPWGDAQTQQGAINRARAALVSCPQADLAVAFEGGLVEHEFGLFTCAWCAVVSSDGRSGLGGGAYVQLPNTAAGLLRAGGELGPVMDSLTGDYNTKQKQGAIGILTSGLVDRQQAYQQILWLALAPFRSPHLYQGDL